MDQGEWNIHNTGKTHHLFDPDKEKEWSGTYFFVQAADCQLGLIQRYLEKNPTPGWQKEIALTNLAVQKINYMNPKPRFFVICGDLCDAFPTKDPEMRAAQEKDLKQILKKLDPSVPLICVCGNHDIGDQPTPQDLKAYNSSFGDDYFSFWCGGVLYIVLNSQFWHDRTQVEEEAARQDEWLEEQLQVLKGSGAKYGVVFQHIPWFLDQYDEEATNYFTIRPEIRQKWLPKFKEAGVKLVLCGHYHRNAGGFYEDLEVVTTSAIGAQLGSDQSGMRVVQVSPDNVKHQYFAFQDFPSSVDFE